MQGLSRVFTFPLLELLIIVGEVQVREEDIIKADKLDLTEESVE